MGSFRGCIAVPLENYCKKYLDGKYSADEIELSEFYEAMLSIIDKLSLNGKADIEDFKSKYFEIQKKSYTELNLEECIKIFEEFKRITGVKL